MIHGLAVAFFFVGVKSAYAGQLHVETYGFAEVARVTGFALAATVLAVDAAKHSIKIIVRKIWVAPKKEADEYRVGDTYDVPLYQGVVWTNPNKSPIERRLLGFLSLEDIKPGKYVIVAGNPPEAVADNPTNRRKADILIGAAEDYAKAASDKELAFDLHDEDLMQVAYDALKARGRLEARLIVENGNKATRAILINHHLLQLTPAETGQFLAAAHPLFANGGNRPSLHDLIYTLSNRMDTTFLAEMGELTDLLDPNIPDDLGSAANAFSGLSRLFKTRTVAVPGTERFSEAFICYHATHPPYVQPEEIPLFIAHLPEAAKMDFYKKMLASVFARTHKPLAKGDMFDQRFLKVVCDAVEAVPAREAVELLKLVDIDAVSVISDKRVAAETAARMAKAIVGKYPDEAANVAAVVGPILAKVPRNP